MRLILLALGGVLLFLSVLSRVRSARWWIRFADFPRIQIACGLVVVLILHAAVFRWGTSFDLVFSIALVAALTYQASRILPYTALAPKQVLLARSPDPAKCIRILISNVLMENRKADRLLELIRAKEPDLKLTLETDDWWRDQLEVLDRDFPIGSSSPRGTTTACTSSRSLSSARSRCARGAVAARGSRSRTRGRHT